jgi:hypothetical protein
MIALSIGDARLAPKLWNCPYNTITAKRAFAFRRFKIWLSNG